MEPRQRILNAHINTGLGALLALSFGLFLLTIGFHMTHMTNPLSEALAKEMQARTDAGLN